MLTLLKAVGAGAKLGQWKMPTYGTSQLSDAVSDSVPYVKEEGMVRYHTMIVY